jgi:hypothetical protein
MPRGPALTDDEIRQAKDLINAGIHPFLVAARFSVSYPTLSKYVLRPVREERREALRREAQEKIAEVMSKRETA